MTNCLALPGSLVSYFGNLFTDEPLPENGHITLDPKKSGFGVTMREPEELNFVRPYPRKSPTPEEVRNRKLSSTPTDGIWTEKAKDVTEVPKFGTDFFEDHVA